MTKRFKPRTSITTRIDPELKTELNEAVLDTGISQNEIVTLAIQNTLKALNDPEKKHTLIERFKKLS